MKPGKSALAAFVAIIVALLVQGVLPATASAGNTINFSTMSSGLTVLDFGGTQTQITTEGPLFISDNSNTSLSISNGSECWSGFTLPALEWRTSTISTDNKVIAANVWAPAANLPILMKVDDSGNPSDAFVQSFAYTTKVGWQKLTWDFNNFAFTGPEYVEGKSYNRITLYPGFDCGIPEANVALDHAGYWYIHDIAFNGAETAFLEAEPDYEPLTGPLPQIAGTPLVGESLTANAGTWRDGTSFLYRWLRDGSYITGWSDSATRVLQPADFEHQISVEVKATLKGFAPINQTSDSVLVSAYPISNPSTQINFSTMSSGLTVLDFGGTQTQITTEGPLFISDNSNNSLSISNGSECFSGFTLPALEWRTSTISTDNKVIAANVWAPAANLPILMKVDDSGNPSDAFVQSFAYTTKVGWQKLTWDFNNFAFTGPEYVEGKSYNRITLYPGFDCGIPEANVALDHAGYWYIHDIAFNGALTAKIVEPPLLKKFKGTVQGKIAGKSRVGSKLYLSHKLLGSNVSYQYQWFRDGDPISGAVDKRYEVVLEDFSSVLSVRVCGTKALYESTCTTIEASSSVTLGMFAKRPKARLSFSKSSGSYLFTAKSSGWESGVELTYTWLRDGEVFATNGADSYQTTLSDKGHLISVEIVAFKHGYQVLIQRTAVKAIP